eukprot:scaffold133347_cov20-Cyclotella_meneghiniana.AAC.1
MTRGGSSWTPISTLLTGEEQPQPHPHSSNIMVIPPPASTSPHQPPQQLPYHTILFNLIDAIESDVQS